MQKEKKLELISVSHTFDDYGQFDVLNKISMHANKGELVCVLGPSGSGKTILLYLIAGFLKPSEGKILFEGTEIKEPNVNRMMVFQDYVLFPWKTVYENVIFGLENKNMKQEDIEREGHKYLEFVGLENFENWNVHKLSGGMQQRLALARALILNPDILLMDEPFSALDSQHRKFLREELINVWKQTGKTIIFVTHSINEAIYLADRIYVLSARPAEVIGEYKITLPRPRDYKDSNFIALSKEIDAKLAKEFEKINELKRSNQYD